MKSRIAIQGPCHTNVTGGEACGLDIARDIEPRAQRRALARWLHMGSAMLRITAFTVVASMFATACSSPLASRRAQVMEPGELEISVVPYAEATAVMVKGSAPQPFAYPSGEITARIGIIDRMDLQLKIDPTIIPEFNVAYQVFGDPSQNDLALTLSAGIKPSVLFLPIGGTFVGAGLITTPLEAIVDVPVNENAILVVGTRVIPAYLFANVGGVGAGAFTIAPGVFGALHIGTEQFFVRPEVAINGVIPLAANSGAAAAPLVGSGGSVNLAAGLGFGMTFDFAKKQDEERIDRDPAAH